MIYRLPGKNPIVRSGSLNVEGLDEEEIRARLESIFVESLTQLGCTGNYVLICTKTSVYRTWRLFQLKDPIAISHGTDPEIREIFDIYLGRTLHGHPVLVRETAALLQDLIPKTEVKHSFLVESFAALPAVY